MYNGPVYRNIFYNESSYVNTCNKTFVYNGRL